MNKRRGKKGKQPDSNQAAAEVDGDLSSKKEEG